MSALSLIASQGMLAMFHQFSQNLMFKLEVTATIMSNKVKSGNFGQRVNSDIHLQTVKIPDETVSSSFSLFA